MSADDLAVAVGDQRQLADLAGDLLDHRLQLLGVFLLLPGLGPIFSLRAQLVPLRLVQGDVVVLLALDQLLLLVRVRELGQHGVFLDPLAVLDVELDEPPFRSRRRPPRAWPA